LQVGKLQNRRRLDLMTFVASRQLILFRHVPSLSLTSSSEALEGGAIWLGAAWAAVMRERCSSWEQGRQKLAHKWHEKRLFKHRIADTGQGSADRTIASTRSYGGQQRDFTRPPAH